MAAQKDLEPGFIITENDVKVIQVDLGETHNYFINHEENSLILGKKLLTKIYKNSLIPKNSVVSINHKNSLLEKIPLGKRLFTLNLELENYLNILKIGDKIDLIAYLEIPGFGKATETILSGIEIIAITNQFHAKERKTTSNSISFYLFPEEVKVLSFMKQYAKFSISLRNPNDISSHSGEAMTLNKFIQNEKTYLEKQPLKKISRINQLIAYNHSGFWQCMDSRRDKEILDNMIKNKNFLWLK
jgi:Flp pilus assembly protein CpaB